MYHGDTNQEEPIILSKINKKQLIENILSELTKQFETLCLAAKATYDGAIHAESKAEDKYDTRGLEASYLAGAQARRASDMENAISLYKRLKARDFGPQVPIALTALVELEVDEKETLYFIGPEAGGMKIEQAGKTITVITPKSPIGKKLIGKFDDDEFDFSAGGQRRSYCILSVS